MFGLLCLALFVAAWWGLSSLIIHADKRDQAAYDDWEQRQPWHPRA